MIPYLTLSHPPPPTVGAHIDTDQSNANEVITLTSGQSTEIKCVAIGIPPPLVFFRTGYFNQNGSVATLLLTEVTVEDSGMYSCYTSNELVNPPTGKRLSADGISFKVKVEGMGCV